jgi:hypothetical protein
VSHDSYLITHSPGRNLHKTLSENKYVNSENETLVVEILRVLAEMVLYGDSKSELLFE